MTTPRGWAALLCVVLAAFVVPSSAGLTAAARADARPTAVVALGDSAISGEGAGSYEPGTRGENGDWCHRSANAFIQQLAMTDRAVNLACSGADSADVSLAPGTHYTEGSQAGRLVALARSYRVRAVVVQVGANDDPAFASTAVACVAAFLNPLAPGCAQTVGPQWPARLAAMAPKVEHAVLDVRAAMARAGYRATDYALVLTSYASPVTEKMVPVLHAAQTCPVRISDARWARTVAVPLLAAALRGVAERTGVRFLDLSRATEGHEACSSLTPGAEWQNRITVNPEALVYGGLDAVGIHLVQESLHPNAVGHAQIAGCLAEFLRVGSGSAQCRLGGDGRLHAVPGAPPASVG